MLTRSGITKRKLIFDQTNHMIDFIIEIAKFWLHFILAAVIFLSLTIAFIYAVIFVVVFIDLLRKGK